eukprot:scaffold30101_cov43-Prasinocladus_malaysianus.AAC.2
MKSQRCVIDCMDIIGTAVCQAYIQDQATATQEHFDRILAVYGAFPEPSGLASAGMGSSGAIDSLEADDPTANQLPVKDCVKYD